MPISVGMVSLGCVKNQIDALTTEQDKCYNDVGFLYIRLCLQIRKKS